MSVTPLPITLDACRDMLSYSRSSIDRLTGIFGQDSEIQDWAEREGYEIVGMARDVGVHSLSQPETREGLQAVVKAIEDKQARGVIVHRLDRLGRDFQTQDAAVQRIWKAGGRVFSTDHGEWFPDKPGDDQWYLRKKFAEVAEAEYYALLARLQEGRRRLIAHGGYGGGHRFGRKYGFETVLTQGVLRYRPIPEEQAIIKRICEACKDGRGYSAMAATLNAEGVLTSSRRAKWSMKVVRSIALRERAVIRGSVSNLPVVSLFEWTKEEAS